MRHCTMPLRTLFAAIAASALFCASVRTQNATPSFDVAAIARSPARTGGAAGPALNTSGRGGVFAARNVTVHLLIQVAYGVRPDALSGGPDWVRTDTFDIEARAATGVPREEILAMLRALLSARFGLELRREQRPADVYVLTVARDDGRLGLDLKMAQTDCGARRPTDPASIITQRPKSSTGLPPFLAMACAPVASLVDQLRLNLKVNVVDETGLMGLWDFALVFDSTLFRGPSVAQRADTSGLPSIFDAVREQLGLALQRGQRPVEMLIIEGIHPPTPN